ncbi:long-chain fatty acid--CoA ligase [Aeromicrobium sp. UC242_57]|uniref:long-chain fatty acid--CoA ligase n=1 Tax=Aeromicrobium sp. UC242_57 TaxID=3374624 RepID=UPI003790784D
MANLAALLEKSAAEYADRTAIVFGDTRLSYAQVNGAANQVANLLVSRGIKPGDKVALSSPNLPYFTIIYYGILKAGATVVPLNVLLRPREVAYHLADSDAKAYFAFEGTPDLPIGENAWEGFQATDTCDEFFLIRMDAKWPAPLSPPEYFAPLVAEQPPTFEMVERDDDDTAVILYTSGTTGQPKGAELRHRNMRDNALAGAELFGADASNPDTYLCVLPLFHSFGQTVIQNGSIAFGGTVVMLPRFEAKAALDLMLANKVTFFAGVPTMYWGLLAALDTAPDGEAVDVETLAANLRVAVAGGAALPGEIHKQIKERFGVTILEGYGLSETSPVASFSVFGQEPRVGSIGKPIPGVEMKLINDDWSDVADDPDAVGEIAIKGHNVMKGYYDRPAATAEAIRDGWFRSGDLAKKDADGFYFIVDRSKDMIIRGGYNVYPRELEEVLMEHPAVSLVAVIGVPNDQHGEEIKAVVVKAPDSDDVSEADLVAWGKEQFAAYKYPRVVEFLDELPMTSTGKILEARALLVPGPRSSAAPPLPGSRAPHAHGRVAGGGWGSSRIRVCPASSLMSCPSPRSSTRRARPFTARSRVLASTP